MVYLSSSILTKQLTLSGLMDTPTVLEPDTIDILSLICSIFNIKTQLADVIFMQLELDDSSDVIFLQKA